MNETPRKMRNDPRALPVNPSDLVVDPPQQADTVFTGSVALVLEFAEESGQTIKFRPFKTIHSHHLRIPHLSIRGTASGNSPDCFRI
jgi:hypothetical protein